MHALILTTANHLRQLEAALKDGDEDSPLGDACRVLARALERHVAWPPHVPDPGRGRDVRLRLVT